MIAIFKSQVHLVAFLSLFHPQAPSVKGNSDFFFFFAKQFKFIHYNNEICCSKPHLFDLSTVELNLTVEMAARGLGEHSSLLTVLFKKPRTEVWLYWSTYFWTYFS